MTKRMLIDATQPEETRVVLTSGNRVDDFDFETASRRQLKGNIYLARVTRVEPSLQAAFVEYGGNRHGFLAFSEIHPDYYRIPMEDREALLAEQQAHAVEDLDDDPDEMSDDRSDDDNPDMEASQDNGDGEEDKDGTSGDTDDQDATEDREAASDADNDVDPVEEPSPDEPGDDGEASETAAESNDETDPTDTDPTGADTNSTEDGDQEPRAKAEAGPRRRSRTERPSRRPSHRRYRIQEVVTRRQIMLVQVVKEERGNKGAALTTFLSLAGRYCVLMPNTPRGGGVSRKITNAVDRKRLKQVVEGLEVPKDMAVIVRTAGSQRTKTEIKRDYEYLLRLWDQIRELTLESSAPCLVHEEANLIKRSIRDLYTRDIDEVLVEGEEGYRTAKSFMKMLVPSHARRVQPFSNGGVPLFHHYQVESQLDGIHTSTVQLRSGGYIVINQTEALVAIDVNSGRSTRERNIEETALKTNLEAADEVARQLRLRDLAGLIVIDFIDMDESRNQHAVERKMKDVVKDDRARIQLGRISQFGLMELSRQRLRPSVTEASTQPCPHCEGTGRVRSIDSAALQILRNIEDEGLKQRASEIIVHVPAAIGFYILNNKRDVLISAEERYAFRVSLQPDDTLIAPEHRIERLGAKTASERNAILNAIGAGSAAAAISVIEDDDDVDGVDTAEVEDEDTQHDRRPRRRRRRSDKGRGEAEVAPAQESADDASPQQAAEGDQTADDEESGEDDDGNKRRRRRGKRGGRRRARRVNGEDGAEAGNDGDTADRADDATAGAESGDLAADVEPSDAVTDNAETSGSAAQGAAGTEEAGAEEAASEPIEEPKAPRKRARRPRRKPEVSETDATANDSQAVAETSVETPEATPDIPVVDQVAAEPIALGAVAPVSGSTGVEEPSEVEVAGPATNGADDPAEAEAPTAVQADQPARKGWWNRLLS